MKKIKPFIIIPVFNEDKVLADVLDEVEKTGYHQYIVIDDGSSDGTFDTARSKTPYALRHGVNRGKGAAIMTGFETAKLLGAEAVVTIDGDGQHNPKDIKKLMAAIQTGTDVALGTRVMNLKNAPPIRIIANFIGNFFTFLFYGIWVQDSQGGMRAYSKKAYTSINIKNDRYEYDSEIIREISRHSLSYKEIPIDVRYTEYSTNKVHKQTIKNGFKMVYRMFISS